MGNLAHMDLEASFAEHYGRVARVIAKVIRDPARAEELAVEVFLRWSRRGGAEVAWLYRTAVRISLDELRRRTRRGRYEALAAFFRATPTPEDLRGSQEEHERVRAVLAAMKTRDAELLLLRSDEASYEELAATLKLNPASVGTLLSRAQRAFRKEYTKRYGEQ
jgi:RNA polymerase sigma-70 factor (ECF subfamily)